MREKKRNINMTEERWKKTRNPGQKIADITSIIT
jgi:hypothetical protein